MKFFLQAIIAIALYAGATALQAAEPTAPGRSKADRQVMSTDAFLDHHPDIKYRLLGLHAYERGRHGEALAHFRHAARYADKPAQSMLAEMLWKGEGTAIDRPLAYAWMDIAAERGYTTMLAFRERYWAQLDEAQKRDALARGAELYREYGDETAKPRLERLLLKAKRDITGSRVGFVGALQIHIPAPGGMVTVTGEQFYADHFWLPAQYWRWQDVEWKKPGAGTVDVGPLQPVKDDGQP